MPVYSKDKIKGCCYYIITASRLLQHWTRNVELEFLLTTTESHEHENILPHISITSSFPFNVFTTLDQAFPT